MSASKPAKQGLLPGMDTENVTVLNVTFEPDHVVINFSRTEEVRLHEGATLLVLGHQLTLSRGGQIGDAINDIEEQVKDLLLDAAQLFGSAPSVADVQAGADREDDDDGDDDEFRGMGE